jgi:hypothetical protein
MALRCLEQQHRYRRLRADFLGYMIREGRLEQFASQVERYRRFWFRNNRRPQRRQMQLIEQALKQGWSVVVDNSNPTVEDRAPNVELARRYGAVQHALDRGILHRDLKPSSVLLQAPVSPAAV